MRLPELDKPLTEYSREDFYDLFDELRAEEWLEHERCIEETVDRYMEFRAQMMPCGPNGLPSQQYRFPIHTRPCYSSSALPPVTTPFQTIVVDIPYEVPQEYVRPLAEQMIRDQIYPQED